MNYLLIPLASLFLLANSNVHAADLGFRYKNGLCVNSEGKKGLNPSFFGPCADLRGSVFSHLNLEGIDFSGSQFSGANIQDLSFKNSIFTDTNFEGASLLGVNLENSKINNSNLNRATFKNVNFIGSEIATSQMLETNFSGSNFQGAIISSCEAQKAIFSELQFTRGQIIKSNFTDVSFVRSDFSNVQLISSIFMRGNFKETALNSASLSHANFEKANLKKAIMTGLQYEDSEFKDATFSAKTILPFSADQAKKLGMVLVRSDVVLILWDELNDYVKSFANSLPVQSNGEVEVELSPFRESDLNGQINLSAYDSIIHFAGKDDNSTSPEISQLGQQSLVAFVKNGGTFIYGEWIAYGVSNGKYQSMLDLILFHRDSGNSGNSELTMTTEGMKHPITSGFNGSISFGDSGRNVGPAVQFETNPVHVLAKDQDGSAAIGWRQLGKGRSVAFNFSCTYDNSKCLDEVPVRQLYINAIIGEK